MKKIIYFFLIIFSFFSLKANPIIIDHKCVQKFESIPDNVLNSLAQVRVMFRHASVGTTINNALDCLQGTRNSPAECKNYPQYKYDRRNFVCQPRGNSGWYGKVDDFVKEVENQLKQFDVFSFKYCYLDGLDGLQEPCGKEFKDVKKAWDYLRDKMEFLEQKYSDKIFVWWTIPLTQTGQLCTDTLNNYIRDYVKLNNKILFDIADIQCHDEQGNYQVNSNGREIAYKPFCGEQQSGAQACHPNWVGSLRIAKAFWWMIYQLNGSQLSIDHKSFSSNDLSIFFQSDRRINIRLNPNQFKATEIIIYDSMGNEIKTYAANQLSTDIIDIDLESFDFVKGVYFLRLISDKSSITKKFIVLK